MANGINRLERFFSKRKGSAASNEISSSVEVTEIVKPQNPTLDETTFPAPSFLRPKGSRMIARDESAQSEQLEEHELGQRETGQRTHSLPQPLSQSVSLHTTQPSAMSAGEATSRAPRHQAIHTPSGDFHTPDLDDFKFPLPPKTSIEVSPISPLSPVSPNSLSVSSTSSKSSPSRTRSLQHRHSSAIVSLTMDTPPASDREDDQNGRPRNGKKIAMPPNFSIAAPPTPDSSPEMTPWQEATSGISHLSWAQKKKIFSPSNRQENNPEGLRRTRSHASISPSAKWNVAPRNVLKGGNVKDFFDLNDDDIAEEEPVQSSQEDAPRMERTQSEKSQNKLSRSASVSTSHSREGSKSRVTEQLPDASTFAAVQVARMAAKHKFDLIYVVKLWPEKQQKVSSDPTSASPTSSRHNSSRNSLLGTLEGTEVKTAAGMTGRLLAAYGLSKVASPFHISAAVHAKILRLEGWVEYRSDDVKAGEFSRGYGHAFQTTKTRTPSTTESTVSPASGVDSDRGIVFAAYRQPGPDGRTKGCTREELEALHTDAEHFIGMLMATHRAKRFRKHTDAKPS